MGVHGLWELLAPVGRRVSVETLAGKKLAIDASIWMIQFMKAMRDDKGEMIRNAHILGFFRRICKLLYLRTKPVFVFDGGTPALKRRTVIARRRQRENAQAKVRKTAEKLLLNHLKTMRLKELAADLEKQRQENDVKGKRPIIQETINVPHEGRRTDDVATNYSQEQLDEMLAATLAAEENEDFMFDASTSASAALPDEVLGEGDEDDEDEEMILPEVHRKVDPAVLAALPPSMQLDLLVQMRERLMAENRQKYQKVKKAPARFSELQIQAYLKTVAFRLEIDGVQKSAAGRGIGGVQTSRIASEANREFIFSSSFIGDKQALTSVGQERVGADQSQPPTVSISAKPANKILQTKNSSSLDGPAVVKTGKTFPDDVETYLDERGHLRVSRVRALGIRMTRDLQRNLDLMKEIDAVEEHENSETTTSRNVVDVQDETSDQINQEVTTGSNNNDGTNVGVDNTKKPAVLNGTSIEISFDDTVELEQGNGDDDDKLFASLVAGESPVDLSVINSTPGRQSSHSASDVEWEDGGVMEKGMIHMPEGAMGDEVEVEWEEGVQDAQNSSFVYESEKTERKDPLQEDGRSFAHFIAGKPVMNFSVDNYISGKQPLHSVSNVEWEDECGIKKVTANMFEGVTSDGEVEWEEGFQDMQKSSSCPDGGKNIASKGAQQEEADLQEAIRRSLEDAGNCSSINNFHEDELFERPDQILNSEEKEGHEVKASETGVLQSLGPINGNNFSYANSASSTKLNPQKSNLDVNLVNKDAGKTGGLIEEIVSTCDDYSEVKRLHTSVEEPSGTCSEGDNGQTVDTCSREGACNNGGSGFSSSFIDSQCNRVLQSASDDDAQKKSQVILDGKPGDISAENLLTCQNDAKERTKEKICRNVSMENEEPVGIASFVDANKEYETTKDHLEEEMLFLGKEHNDLATEQRKLERNAESVSNEMFAECQELLQMFGLPYIIAPMEAEAQCAFMEMSNLVDGVVTDDSDAFLFGAQSVYKNIFDDRKYVETYLMKDIENELGLDQEKLIRMALLLGSDYTEGVSGIGIVNAIEVVNAFPERDGLRHFREWVESPDPAILGKLNVEAGGNTRRKGSKGSKNSTSSKKDEISFNQDAEPEPVDDGIKQIFMDKHRNVSKNWHIPSTFPSDAVISAYASPQVDNSTEVFAWGKPDLFVLRKLCWEKFGWGSSKADELLVPVLKEYNKHETQLRLEAFYSFNERFAKIRSKRIKKAVKGIAGAKSSELMDEMRQEPSRSGKKRKMKYSKDDTKKISSTVLGGANTDQDTATVKPNYKHHAKGGQNSQGNSKQSTTRRARGRGRGHQSGRGRGRRKEVSVSADTETSHDEDNGSEREEEVQFGQLEESHELRRSGRIRKTVDYSVSDDCDKATENCLEESFTVDESLVNQAIGSIDEKKSDGHKTKEGNSLGVDGGIFAEQTYSMEKMSTNQINNNPLVDSLVDDCIQQSDYLQFGGGFCEEEEQAEPDQNKSEASVFTGSGVEPNNEIDPSRNPTTQRDCSSPDTENGSGSFYSRSLCAMPNLRRKKRKT